MKEGLTNKKINLHITENCNYKCKYCFSYKCGDGIQLGLGDWKTIVDNCIDVFRPMGFNIAGGEPLLYKQLPELIRYIKSKGLYCSIITNGSLLTWNWIQENAEYLDCIGISVDSFDRKLLFALGATHNFSYLSFERLKEICDCIKAFNPNCQIKINTVVCKLNKMEVLLDQLNSIGYEIRWKILKMKESNEHGYSNEYLSITDEEYRSFFNRNTEGDICWINDCCCKHKNAYLNIIAEDTMKNSYLIIMPHGYMISNSNKECEKVANCLDIDDMKSKIKLLNFNSDLYESRY